MRPHSLLIHEDDVVVELSERVAGEMGCTKMKQRHKLHVYMKNSSRIRRYLDRSHDQLRDNCFNRHAGGLEV